MKLLIYANAGDLHADAVSWACSRAGITVSKLLFHLFPSRLASSASISDGEALAITTWPGPGSDSVDHSAFDVVWNRRVSAPEQPRGLHSDDVELWRKNALTYVGSVRAAWRPGQVWVNPREAQVRVEDKLYQLGLARSVGLRIPTTLISNDPQRIRSFVQRCDHAVAKALRPLFWTLGDTSRAMPTVTVTAGDLGSDEAIAACPMIYQQRIEKAYEIRAVLFGSELVCCRLESQQVDKARTDFRLVNPKQLAVSPAELPPHVVERLLRFAREAGVLHGSFDLAVTPESDVVFFEFNEQGQTLWLEQCAPEMRILDRLCSFLAKPSREFRWSGEARFSFNDFLDEEAIRRAGVA